MRSGLMLIGINIARVARLIRCRARHRKRGFAQRGAGECQDTSGAGRDSGTLRLRQRLSFLSAKLGPPRASPRVVGLGRRLVCILHRAGRVRQALRIARLPCPRDRSAPAASMHTAPSRPRSPGPQDRPRPRAQCRPRSTRVRRNAARSRRGRSPRAPPSRSQCPVFPGLLHLLDAHFGLLDGGAP